MGWAERTYAATKSAGVYWTADSLDPSLDQPVWAALNDGLTYTALRAFCLDRSETPWDTRMFCIDETSGTLWRRTAGDWEAIKTAEQARVEAGFSDGQTWQVVTTDPITGYVYAVLGILTTITDFAIARSTDHGDTWTYKVLGGGYVRAWGDIDAYDGLVVHGRTAGYIVYTWHLYSTDHGQTWASFDSGGVNSRSGIRIDQAAGDSWYGNVAPSGVQIWQLMRGDTAGTIEILLPLDLLGPNQTGGGIWIDPDDNQHMVTLYGTNAGNFAESRDAFLTVETAVQIGGSNSFISEIATGCTDGCWPVGRYTGGGNGLVFSIGPDLFGVPPHYGAVPRSGANYAVAPYEGSIPFDNGGLTYWGLWAVGRTPGHWRVCSCRYEEAS